MAYQVLARKYRPKNFESLIGQDHIVRALTHALTQNRLHHAYLFTGTRGVGKTTIARILAKALNCQGVDGNGTITAQPCGVCHACVGIDSGRFVDYIEMDAASNRGVDEMAQLLEQALYASSNARFKVYMIDEVHMLTSHAFNSMLKTLEEPPAHVKFILATTDPQKIPVTVLSRCLQFNLKQMPPVQIVTHLETILQSEQIEFEIPALRLLAQGAQGSMRDALSLTDQAIAYAAGTITLDAVQTMLGVLDQSYLFDMLEALVQKNAERLLAITDEMALRSVPYHSALQDLAALLHRIALAQRIPAAIADDMPERDAIFRLAALFDAEELQLLYQIALQGRQDLSLAPDEYAGFSMTLLRMLAFQPEFRQTDFASAPEVDKILKLEAGLDKKLAESSRLANLPRAAVQISQPLAVPNVANVSIHNVAIPNNSARAALEAARQTAKTRTESQNTPISVIKEKVIPSPASPPSALINWEGDWTLLAASLPLRGVVQQLAQQSELVECKNEANKLTFHLRIPVETLLTSASCDKLAAALTQHFKQPVKVTTEIGAVQQTAHARRLGEQNLQQQQAEELLRNDEAVKALRQTFGAEIVPGSIKLA